MRFSQARQTPIREGEFNHSMMLGAQVVKLPRFVLEPAAREDHQFRILPLWPSNLAPGSLELLLGEVLALQKARQIGRADD